MENCKWFQEKIREIVDTFIYKQNFQINLQKLVFHCRYNFSIS